MQEDHGGYLHTSLGGYLPQALGSVGVTSSGNVYSETPPESTADMDRDAKLQARRERNKLAGEHTSRNI